MGKIEHCKRNHKAKTCWLRSWEPQYMFIVVHVLNSCPTCKQKVIEWHGIDIKSRKSPQTRIKTKEHDDFMIRIRTHAVYADDPELLTAQMDSKKQPSGKEPKEMRACSMISDGSKQMAKDPQDFFKSILAYMAGKPFRRYA